MNTFRTRRPLLVNATQCIQPTLILTDPDQPQSLSRRLDRWKAKITSATSSTTPFFNAPLPRSPWEPSSEGAATTAASLSLHRYHPKVAFTDTYRPRYHPARNSCGWLFSSKMIAVKRLHRNSQQISRLTTARKRALPYLSRAFSRRESPRKRRWNTPNRTTRLPCTNQISVQKTAPPAALRTLSTKASSSLSSRSSPSPSS